jgi:ribonuclease HI
MEQSLKLIEIYTDGACSGNPGPGGWGAILQFGENYKEISGFVPDTTNNRMEITAVIEALKLLKYPCAVKVYSDSAYVVNAFNQKWIVNWQKNNWKSKSGNVLNQDLWQELLKCTRVHKVEFIKVKGHADNKYNNRCDELAVSQIKAAKK